MRTTGGHSNDSTAYLIDPTADRLDRGHHNPATGPAQPVSDSSHSESGEGEQTPGGAESQAHHSHEDSVS